MKLRRGFTLIELLVSIAIMGLLIALLVPNINRSLQKNQIAEDVELFKAKLEETRLMAGSTQQSSTGDNGYYGVYIAPGENDEFYIVRVDKDPNKNDVGICGVTTITNQISDSGEVGSCVVERVAMTGTIANPNSNGAARIVAYNTPVQQLVAIRAETGGQTVVWAVYPPVFSASPVAWDPFAIISSKNTSKTAEVKLGDYSGKVTVEYKTIE